MKEHALIKSDLFGDAHRDAFDRIAQTATEVQQQCAAGVPTPVPSPYQRGTTDWKEAYGISPRAAAMAGAGIGGGLGALGGHYLGLNLPELASLYFMAII